MSKASPRSTGREVGRRVISTSYNHLTPRGRTMPIRLHLVSMALRHRPGSARTTRQFEKEVTVVGERPPDRRMIVAATDAF